LFSSQRIASSCLERGWVRILVDTDSMFLFLFFNFPAFDEGISVAVEGVALEFGLEEFLVLRAIEFSLEEAAVLRGVA
jgi:hypothetical protein